MLDLHFRHMFDEKQPATLDPGSRRRYEPDRLKAEIKKVPFDAPKSRPLVQIPSEFDLFSATPKTVPAGDLGKTPG